MTNERKRLETVIGNQERWIEEGLAEGNVSKVKRYKKALKRSRRELADLGKPEADTLSITVQTIRRTEKAIEVAVVEDHTGQLAGWRGWLPLSQIVYLERAMGPCDLVEIPGWLVNEKKAER